MNKKWTSVTIGLKQTMLKPCRECKSGDLDVRKELTGHWTIECACGNREKWSSIDATIEEWQRLNQ